jgi:hypothetical protein
VKENKAKETTQRTSTFTPAQLTAAMKSLDSEATLHSFYLTEIPNTVAAMDIIMKLSWLTTFQAEQLVIDRKTSACKIMCSDEGELKEAWKELEETIIYGTPNRNPPENFGETLVTRQRDQMYRLVFKVADEHNWTSSDAVVGAIFNAIQKELFVRSYRTYKMTGNTKEAMLYLYTDIEGWKAVQEDARIIFRHPRAEVREGMVLIKYLSVSNDATLDKLWVGNIPTSINTDKKLLMDFINSGIKCVAAMVASAPNDTSGHKAGYGYVYVVHEPSTASLIKGVKKVRISTSSTQFYVVETRKSKEEILEAKRNKQK